MPRTAHESELHRRSYLKHHEARLAARRAYYNAHREEERAARREHYAKNRDAILEATHAPEEVAKRRATSARHYAGDVEGNRERNRAWKAANKEHSSEVNKVWYRRRGKYLLRMRIYGLTEEQFETMIAAQGNACAICRVTFCDVGGPRTEIPYVDHDHATGRVRALLCVNCNFLIGHCREETTTLLAAVAYLEAQKEAK